MFSPSYSIFWREKYLMEPFHSTHWSCARDSCVQSDILRNFLLTGCKTVPGLSSPSYVKLHYSRMGQQGP